MPLSAIPENDPPQNLASISDTPFAFDSSFKMTTNLIKTTSSLIPGNKS